MYKDALILFQKEFWKDSRNIVITNNSKCLRKYYDNSFELNTEINILEYLKNNTNFRVPQILHIGDTYTEMQYFKGIRIFNLLVEIDLFSTNNAKKAKLIKTYFLERCEKEQIELQKSLLNFYETYNICTPYPFSKISTAIEVLKLCLNIQCNELELNQELRNLYDVYQGYTVVPFRDATTKNMILADEQLHLGLFNSLEDRREYLFNLFQKENVLEYFNNSPIINFDFSSCINTTTPEDDYISFHYHERTWDEKKSMDSYINWLADKNPYRAAITFIIRFLRFGGRKAAYKILHKDTAKVRFKYDNPQFYFNKLPLFITSVCPEIINKYPHLINFINEANKKINTIDIKEDYFMKAGLGSNEKSYIDVFPN